MYDTELERVDLNDIKHLQMFERPPVNPEIGTYKCHIACKRLYKEYMRNENNIVNASWLFHQYFDGLVTHDIIPLLLVRPWRVWGEETLLVGGREITRFRIEVYMDFTTEEGLQQILPLLHGTPTMDGPKRLRTYIHAINPEEMCQFFALKYEETAQEWKRKKISGTPNWEEVQYEHK
jgi:hypothetical protein